MRRAYSSRPFGTKKQGRPWKWMFVFLIIGFVLGIIVDQSISARKPIELIISAPSSPEVIEGDVRSIDQEGAWSDEQDAWVPTPKEEENDQE